MVFSIYLVLVNMSGQTVILRHDTLKLFRGFLIIKCIYDGYNQHWLAESITFLNKAINVTAMCIFDGYICTLLERRVLLW